MRTSSETGKLVPRIAWLYAAESHRANPILVQALESLAGAGADVRVYDFATSRIDSSDSYHHMPAGKFTLWPVGVTSFGLRGASKLGKMFTRALAWRPQLVVASDPDVGCVGWLLSAVLGIPLVYYPFELFGEEFLRPDTFQTRLLARAERALLAHGVDGIITQNTLRAEVYTAERRSRVQPVIVHNYKPRWRGHASGELKRLLGLDESQRVVLYEGVLQDGRCLENLIQAVPSFPPNTVLVFIGQQTEYATRVLAPLAARVAPESVKFAPGVPHAELLRLVSGADVGVVVYDERSRNNRFCAPGKLSDYVHAGVPVIASALPTLVPVVERYGIGACFANESPRSIASAVDAVLQTTRPAWRVALERAQEHLAWETQEPALRQAVFGLLRDDTERAA